jgi:tetratricopeptide (TPR) repeat protein
VTWLASLGLIGLNAWWAQDRRAAPGLEVIASWVASRQPEKAERALRELVRRSPFRGDARMMLGRLLAARDDRRGCAEQLHAVPFWWPTKAEALYREAQAWMAVDRAKDAEAAYLAYLRDDPNHPVDRPFETLAEVELINLYALEGRWDEARGLIWRQYERVRSRGEDPHELLFMSLRTRLETSAPQVAAETLRRYVRSDATDVQAARALARATQALGQEDEATRLIRRCLALRPNDPLVWRDWLGILHARSDLDGMRAALGQAPPETANALANLGGRVDLLRGDFPGACAAFRRGLEQQPFDSQLHYDLSIVESRLGRSEKARYHRSRHESIRKARAILPDVFDQYVDAKHAGAPQQDPKVTALIERIAELCRTLGWTTDAQAWSRLRDPH